MYYLPNNIPEDVENDKEISVLSDLFLAHEVTGFLPVMAAVFNTKSFYLYATDGVICTMEDIMQIRGLIRTGVIRTVTLHPPKRVIVIRDFNITTGRYLEPQDGHTFFVQRGERMGLGCLIKKLSGCLGEYVDDKARFYYERLGA